MVSITHWRRQLNTQALSDPAVVKLLSPEIVEQLCRDAGHRWRASFWSPGTTVLTFLLQVLSATKTLRAAVASYRAQLAARGESELPSADPAAYCQARQRLPGEALTGLLHMLSEHTQELVSRTTGWLGRQVWIVDGSSASTPDKPELQECFPQPSQQAPGCGFPVIQFVALFCWATGTIVDLAISSLQPHELPLFRTLWHYFRPGDVVLADRAYCAYVDMVRLQLRDVFCVCRLHQRRKADFRRGKRLGHDDCLVTWRRPDEWRKSFGISVEEFLQLPETLAVRLVRITHTPKGFRSGTLVVATTLVDPIETPADQIRMLYRDRWTAELNFRSLKISLGMDILRGTSVDIVLKEIAMHLVAYNLIRLLMWHAARRHGCDLHRLSFTGTLHRLQATIPLLIHLGHSGRAAALFDDLLACVATDRVPYRPDRIEPRCKKRRPKGYDLLNRPRRSYYPDVRRYGR